MVVYIDITFLPWQFYINITYLPWLFYIDITFLPWRFYIDITFLLWLFYIDITFYNGNIYDHPTVGCVSNSYRTCDSHICKAAQ